MLADLVGVWQCHLFSFLLPLTDLGAKRSFVWKCLLCNMTWNVYASQAKDGAPQGSQLRISSAGETIHFTLAYTALESITTQYDAFLNLTEDGMLLPQTLQFLHTENTLLSEVP